MKKLMLVLVVLGTAFTFTACEDDPMNEVQPNFDIENVQSVDGEGQADGEV